MPSIVPVHLSQANLYTRSLFERTLISEITRRLLARQVANGIQLDIQFFQANETPTERGLFNKRNYRVWEVETKLSVTICVNACTRENSHRGIMEFLARLGDNLINGGFGL